MTGSKLAIFKVTSPAALDQALCCDTSGWDLLILSAFGKAERPIIAEVGRSILYFDNDYPPGVMSKLAFSFAMERGYDWVAGVFDWNSISFQELSNSRFVD